MATDGGNGKRSGSGRAVRYQIEGSGPNARVTVSVDVRDSAEGDHWMQAGALLLETVQRTMADLAEKWGGTDSGKETARKQGIGGKAPDFSGDNGDGEVEDIPEVGTVRKGGALVRC